MKKLIISVAALFGISSMAMTSCQEQLPQEVQEQWEEKQDEVVSAVTNEMKKALEAQLDEFLQSDDLENSLGFSQEQVSQIEQSVEEYIDNYEFDTETLTKLTGELELLLDEAKGLTKEELQAKLDEILEK